MVAPVTHFLWRIEAFALGERDGKHRKRNNCRIVVVRERYISEAVNGLPVRGRVL